MYEQLGILEYWLFDPKGEWVNGKLQGYRLQDEIYQPITNGISQPLQLRLDVEGELLRFYRLDTGAKLLIPRELAELAQQEQQRTERLAERLRALGVDPDGLS
jgi:hypothetical protein